MIIATLTPHNHMVSWEFVNSLLKVFRQYPFFMVQSPYLAGNRNKIYANAKSKNEDVLMIDSDIIFTEDDVKRIEKDLQTYDVVSGVYAMGAQPHQATIFKREGELYEYLDPPKAILPIDAAGAGFLGISKRAFPVLQDEPFNPLSKTDGGEDVSFCERAKEAGLTVVCDGAVRVGHMRMQPIYA